MITQVWRGEDNGPRYMVVFTRDDGSWDAEQAVVNYLAERFGWAGWLMIDHRNTTILSLDVVVNDHEAEVVVLKSPEQIRRVEEKNTSMHSEPPAEEIVEGPGIATDLPEYHAGLCKGCKFWKQSDSYAKYLKVETKEGWGKCSSAEAAELIEGNIERAVGDPRATSGRWPLAVGGAVTREDFGCPFFGEPER
jgi:hypothetical protein